MKSKDLVVIVPIIVVVLGIIGFLQEGSTFYAALLSSLNLLKVCLDPLPANILIEAARWLGIVFFFGLIYAALVALIERGLVLAKVSRKDSVAVHGDSVYAEMLLKALGKSGVRSGNKLAFKAAKQVIIFEKDSKAIEFYQKHAAELSKADEIHICLDLGSHVSIESHNVFVTNMSEIRAIDYWRKHYSTEQEKIVIVGSGRLPESVLYWALLTNVFAVDCGNKYAVLGAFDKFIATHGDIAGTVSKYGNDDIRFYKDAWYSDIELIKDADRIILCDDTLDNVEMALDMRSLGINCPIHIFAENSSISVLADKSMTIVGTLSKDNIKSVLLMDSIHEAGKMCHATYMILEKREADAVTSGSISDYLQDQEFIDSWKSLNSFTRGSNYATAIHDPLKKALLKEAGIDTAGLTAGENEELYNRLSGRGKDRLQEIEHIRWCRYHLLNNWKKPEGDIIIDGVKKAKDTKHRLHSDLVPYNELSQDDKEKDAYFYKTLAVRDC